jgi:hypothetical protein
VNPLGGIETFEGLEAQVEKSEVLRDLALANLNGGTIELADGKTYELSAEQARKMFQEHDAILRRHVPARERELMAAAHRERGAREAELRAADVYPWMGKKESPEYGTFQKLASLVPELQREFADWPMFIADMTAGFLARKAKGAGGSAGAGTGAGGGGGNNLSVSLETTPAPAIAERKPAPPAPLGGGAAGGPRVPSSNPKQQEALSRVLKQGGDRDSIAAFLEAAG